MKSKAKKAPKPVPQREEDRCLLMEYELVIKQLEKDKDYLCRELKSARDQISSLVTENLRLSETKHGMEEARIAIRVWLGMDKSL